MSIPEERPPEVTKLYNKILHGTAALNDPEALPNQLVAIRSKLKLYYHQLIVGHPVFSASSRILGEFWEILYRKPIESLKGKSQIARQQLLDEGLGSLVFVENSLARALIRADKNIFSLPSSSNDELFEERKALVDLIYDCTLYMGDLQRYANEPELAEGFYRKARDFVPTYGRAYNQLGVLSISKKNPLPAIYNLLMAAVVKVPFGMAQENLRLYLQKNPTEGSFDANVNVIVRSLQEALGSRASLHKSAVAKKTDFLSQASDKNTETALLWLVIYRHQGILDKPSASPILKRLLQSLCGLLSDWIGDESADSINQQLMPILHVLIKGIPDTIKRTKHYEKDQIWDPIAHILVNYCNDHVGLEEGVPGSILPEDEPYIGLPCYCDDIKQTQDLYLDRLAIIRRSRIFDLADALKNAGVLGLADGIWMGQANLGKLKRQSKTMALLARQRLVDQVQKLEERVGPVLALQNLPWSVPDFEWLIDNWTDLVLPNLNNLTARYIVTFSVLSELDYVKNDPSERGQLARSIIRQLAELTNKHAPNIRLQRMNETQGFPPAPLLLGPKDRYRHEFVDAIAYYNSQGEPIQVLSDDPKSSSLL